MVMRLSQLKTHWTADDAYTVLSLLDELRDVLWETYGAEIVEQQHQAHQKGILESRKIDTNDVIDF